jgi:hypothetical protein
MPSDPCGSSLSLTGPEYITRMADTVSFHVKSSTCRAGLWLGGSGFPSQCFPQNSYNRCSSEKRWCLRTSLFCSSSFIRWSSGLTDVRGGTWLDKKCGMSVVLLMRLSVISRTDFGDSSDETEDDEAVGMEFAPVMVPSSLMGCE